MLRSRFSWIVLGCLILTAAFFTGCSMESGNPVASSMGDTDVVVESAETGGHPQFVRSVAPPAPAQKGVVDKGGKRDKFVQNRGISRKDLYVKQVIKSVEGGALEFLLPSTQTEVRFFVQPNSIPQDEIISMALPAKNILTLTVGDQEGLVFGPHDLTFNPPAELTIKSRHLVVPEGDLYLYYWNGEMGTWEQTDQRVQVEVDEDEVTITTKVHHFSHYAFGARR